MLTIKEGSSLVKVLWKSIAEYLTNGKWIDFKLPKIKSKKMGVFVTLKKNERKLEKNEVKFLHSCGYPFPSSSIVNTALYASIGVAVYTRSLLKKEIKEIENFILELDLLTPLQSLDVLKRKDYPKNINIKRDGIMMEKGLLNGTVLPQFSIDYGLTALEGLSECCIRAGLLATCWLKKDVNIYKFQTQTFRREPNGEISKINR